MDTENLSLSDDLLEIGAVFTPLPWGEFAAEKFKIFDQWLKGASVFDPTMGEGSLLESLICFGLKQGFTIKQLPTHSLYGNEINSNFYREALKKFREKYNIDLSSNLWNEDIFSLSENKGPFDILFGNPPWQNFVDLGEEYKIKIKKEFFKYDLVENSQKLLLGGSRIDLSALVIQKTIKEFLKTRGRAYFFLPLSLFLGGGASQHFRKYAIENIRYSVKKIYDFNDLRIFDGISTRYGLASFQRNEKQSFPIKFTRLEKKNWLPYFARPILNPRAPLSILRNKEGNPLENFTFIRVKKESSPRQGVNSCGANSVFFFDSYQELDSKSCLVSNIKLPKKYIYPLLSAPNFRQKKPIPSKWVLLPYLKNGRPLEKKDIINEKSLFEYLSQNKKVLENRKGSLIGSYLKRGYWWSLLGVASYSFFPYKIVWEAYGRSVFKPMIVKGEWQANQSLQAFIPLQSLKDAKRILLALQDPAIEDYLLSLKMEGTMNWAQPGKIKALLNFMDFAKARKAKEHGV